MISRVWMLLLAAIVARSAPAQFTGSYYSGTNFGSLLLTRQDPTIDFGWGAGSPAASVPADQFSVRWTGTLEPQSSDVHTFYVTSDDGIRLWVDGALVIDDWTPHSAQEFTGQVGLTAHHRVDIVLEFFEQGGTASCVFEWSSPSMPRELVHTAIGPPEPAGSGFDAVYYAGRNFDTLVLTRKDPVIDFGWGAGAPDLVVPPNDFSVRWSGTVQPFYSETYTFHVTSDDGVRLFVDGLLVIDEWTQHATRQSSAQVALTADTPVAIVLEYCDMGAEASCVFEWSAPSLARQLVRTGSGGLAQLVPVGAFLDGALPRGTPMSSAGNFVLEDAYPNLRFRDPLSYTPEPGTNRVCVGSRQGLVEVFDNVPGASTKSVFLDIRDRCAVVWDGGLLGLAFHPQWNQPGQPNRNHFYAWYSYAAPGTTYPTASTSGFFNCYLRLSRFTRPDGWPSADPGSEQVLLNLRLYNGSHRGGGLFFGGDGFLYLSIGDQYRDANAQNLTGDFDGGVIRIDVDQQGGTISHPPRRLMGVHAGAGDEWSGAGYYIPSDNPFLDAGGSLFEEFWALGNRNPHRMTLDVPTQRIWMGEVGNNQREEINVIVRGGNYQWPFREGFLNGTLPRPANPWGTEVPPVLDFTRSEAGSIIGGYVYRGAAHPSLVGRYLCGDYSQFRIWALDYDPVTNTATKTYLLSFTPGSLCTFGQDQYGEVYLCGLGTDVPIYRLGREIGYPEAPELLSQTGVFTDLATLTPHPALIPYSVNTPLWSDGALKRRWFAVPNDGRPDRAAEQIAYREVDEWGFPVGSVLVKHFETPAGRRLETRLLVRGETGWYGITYRWDPSGLDATLLTTSLQEQVVIGNQTVDYYYPSRTDCLTCHKQQSGSVLGLKTRQLNADLTYPSSGRTANQIATLNHLGLLSPAIDPAALPTSITNVALLDTTAPLERRLRSYLDANCAQCHRPGQGHSTIDARSTQSLPFQGIIDGVVSDDLGIAGAKVVVPADLQRSILFQRFVSPPGCCSMPPLGRGLVDQDAVAMLQQWIEGLDPQAASGTVTQSSTVPGGPAQNAVDGQIDGQHNGGAGPGPTTLTSVESEPWWEADLGTQYDLERVRLWNRTDCCSGRLSDFWVFLSPSPFTGTTIAASRAQHGVTAVRHPGTVGRDVFVELQASGRYLRIQLAGTDALSLAEVQLVGCTAGAGLVGLCAHRVNGGLAATQTHAANGSPMRMTLDTAPQSLAGIVIGLVRSDYVVGPVTLGVGSLFAVHVVGFTDADGHLAAQWNPPAIAVGIQFFTQGLVLDHVRGNQILVSNVIGTTITP